MASRRSVGAGLSPHLSKAVYSGLTSMAGEFVRTPKRGEAARWLERKDGQPVFGPESPIATKAACDAAGGVFRDSIFGWMVHANVFEGNDARAIWGDEHAAHDMHDGMKMDGSGP